ncbi:dTDP-glucose 4,6-dehydratase [Sinomicrobium sp.]
MKHILITGGLGFIGTNFISYFLKHYPDYHLINLDLVTYAANSKHLEEVEDRERYTFVKGNICDRQGVHHIFEKYDIRGLIHFAAESHVDNSINTPGIFMETNVQGTYTLLDVAFKYWMKAPFQYREGYENCRFHHISTDEVYGSLGPEGLFTEQTPYAPNSPYSASKAASDMIVRSYHHTYGLDMVITNCSNNYGPYQHTEKLIPTIIKNALKGLPIPIYGDGSNIRDWLYVEDHCRGIDLAFHKGRSGEVYNIGGQNEKNNNEIVHTVCTLLDELHPAEEGSYSKLITYVKDRPGHDSRYAIDATKITRELGWRAEENFESGILKTVQWYLDQRSND